MSGKGFLMAMMEPVATFEEEFQDWYDNEHVPERMAIPGFETGQRFVCLAGFPKYAAFYDLSSLDVLRSPEYSRVVGAGLSPLTLRVRAKTVGRYRFTGTQIYPGAANLGASKPRGRWQNHRRESRCWSGSTGNRRRKCGSWQACRSSPKFPKLRPHRRSGATCADRSEC